MPESKKSLRQPYHAPELRVHGLVEQLTKFSPGGNQSDGFYGTGTAPSNGAST
jgi:hypothetical protein